MMYNHIYKYIYDMYMYIIVYNQLSSNMIQVIRKTTRRTLRRDVGDLRSILDGVKTLGLSHHVV